MSAADERARVGTLERAKLCSREPGCELNAAPLRSSLRSDRTYYRLPVPAPALYALYRCRPCRGGRSRGGRRADVGDLHLYLGRDRTSASSCARTSATTSASPRGRASGATTSARAETSCAPEPQQRTRAAATAAPPRRWPGGSAVGQRRLDPRRAPAPPPRAARRAARRARARRRPRRARRRRARERGRVARPPTSAA